MIARKLMLYMACFALTGTATAVRADDTSPAQRSISIGIAGQNIPRYSGSDKHNWQVVPVVQARDGAFFLDSEKGVGYDLQTDNGFWLEHTLGYSLGRSERNSLWRDGSDKLKGMGNINPTVNTAIVVGWSATSWLTLEGKATLPLSESQGVSYQTSVTLVPWQTSTDTVALSSAALFGDSRYMNTNYGVNIRQSRRSGYSFYSAPGGFYGVDTSLTWDHQLTEQWGILVSVDYQWLGSHAADSQIVSRRNEVGTTLGVLYSF